MKTENIMLNELNKTQKNKYSMTSHIWGTQNSPVWRQKAD